MPEKETLPNPQFPTWYSSSQTPSSVSINPGGDPPPSSSLHSPELLPASLIFSSASPTSVTLLLRSDALLRRRDAKHLLEAAHGAFTRASASMFTTAKGQQPSATQSPIANAVHERQDSPGHSTWSFPPWTTSAIGRRYLAGASAPALDLDLTINPSGGLEENSSSGGDGNIHDHCSNEHLEEED